MAGIGLIFLRRGGQAHPTAGSDYIRFADEEVLRILMSNGVSSDGVGITREDAEKITTFGTWFKNNTAIVSFDEMSFFTNVKTIAQDEFYGCASLSSVGTENITTFGKNSFYGNVNLQQVDFSSASVIGEAAFQNCPLQGELVLIGVTELKNNTFRGAAFTRIILPNIVTINQSVWQGNKVVEYLELGASVTAIGGYSFYQSGLKTIICRAVTPPNLGDGNTFTNATIYVPDASVDAYKAATRWSSHAARIKGISEYNG